MKTLQYMMLFLLLAALALLPASCDFFATAFPDSLTQLDGDTSVRDFLSPEDGAHFELEAIYNGQKHYVIAFKGGAGASPRAAILGSGSLEAKAELKDNRLGPPFFPDAQNAMVLRELRIGTDLSVIGDISTLTPGGDWLGGNNGTENLIVTVNTANNPDLLAFDGWFTADWSGTVGTAPDVAITNTSELSRSFFPIKAWSDSANLRFVILLKEQLVDGYALLALFLPYTPLPDGLKSPLLDSYDYISLGEAPPELVHYTHDGFVVGDYSGKVRLIGFDGQEKASEQLYEDGELDLERFRETYRMDGEYRYLFDTEKGRILQYRAWW